MSKPNWFSIVDRGESRPVEIFIYDAIGKDWFSDDGISAKDFAEGLKPHANRDLVVAINSPGGNVWDGLTIANLLKQHRGHVETRVDGIAASIASVIFLAGKSRTMAENALVMIHDPSGATAGKAHEHRAMADRLDKIGNTLAETYASATGKPKEDFITAMAAEKFFDANEAKEWGLTHTITPALKAAASFDFSAFKNRPASLTATDTVKLQNELQKERRLRFEKDVDACIADRRIVAADREFWIDAALKNEETITRIKAMPQQLPPEGVSAGIQDDPSVNAQLEKDHQEYVAKLKKFRNQK
jgi:ATP-dependent Clp protease, protease subunit